MTTKLRVALIGSRGIPACYGGYETLMEELSTRLVARGYPVTVYCRSHYTPRGSRRHRGVRLVVLPTVKTKHLDTPVHTLLSCLHAVVRRYDVAVVVNAANAIFVPLLRLSGIPTALHIDGIEKRRAKWGILGRLVYALSERLATALPNTIVTDSQVIRQFYLQNLGADSSVITYGVDPDPLPPGRLMRELDLKSRGFFLYVSRFEPENNPHRVAAAYRNVGGDLPLVMVGGAPYARRFIRSFTLGADPRIIFPGPVYGHGYRELLSNALAYIHATEVGGTHPALVEAIGFGNCVVVSDTPENRETAGSDALYYRVDRPASLAAALEEVRLAPEQARKRGAEIAAVAARRFRWSDVVEQYIRLFHQLAASKASRGRSS